MRFNAFIISLQTISSQDKPYVVQRRVAWSESSQITRSNRTQLKSIQGELFIAEQEVQSNYWIFLVYLVLVTTIFVPVHAIVHTFSKTLFEMNFLLLNLSVIVIIVLIETQKQTVKSSTADNLALLLLANTEEEVRRDVRHQLLQLHHHPESFNCYLFDVDFSLLATMVESTLLIVTTMLSN